MRYILIVLCCIMCVSCQGKETKHIFEKNIPQEKQIRYALQINAPIPVTVFFNDIKISQKNTPVNMQVELNPFILNNGNYNIELKVDPIFRYNDSLVEPSDLNNIKIRFVSYIWNKDTDEISEFITDKKLPLKKVKQPTASFEQSWNVEVKDLPYQLQGWRGGQDLSKIDTKQLEQKVVSYYQNLRELLNSGNYSAYDNLWETANTELITYDYFSEQRFEQKQQATNLEIQKCKDKMIALQDYEMKLYAHGKIVCLERKTNTRGFNNEDPLNLKGWSPLIRKYKVSGGASYGVKLYLPQGSDEFVIIRN